MHCTIQFWTKRANSWWHSEPRAGWQQPETFSLRSMSDTPLTSLQLSQKIEEADFYLERSWSPRPLQAQPEERLISRVCWFVAQFPLLLLPHSVASSKHSNDSGSQLVVLLRSVEETITDGFQKWPMHLTRVPVTYKKQWASTASSPHLCFHHEQETSPNDRFCFLLPTTKRKKKKKKIILSAPSGLTEAPAAGDYVPLAPLPDPTEEGAGPIRAAPLDLARRKAATQPALLSHIKQEKSVLVTQLSLRTTKWVEVFKHSKKKGKKKKDLSKCTQRNTTKNPPTANLKNKQKPQINAIKV